MTSVIYLLGVFLLVSILPRRAALIAIFSFLFGHFFGATNWLAIRWHLGTNSSSIYALALAPMIVFVSISRNQLRHRSNHQKAVLVDARSDAE